MNTVKQPPIRSRAIHEGSTQVSWLGLLLPSALMAVCFLSGISALGLTGPDEPRYAAIARDMARTGDWVTPRLNGQPWFEKPPLYYWLAGASFRVFGEGEFAMRLPSVLAAVLATLAAAWAALRACGLDAATFTLLMLPVTIGLIGFSHSAAPDMLFAALLAATAAAAAEMLQSKRPGMPSKIAFGFLLGAATLAKGPAAVLLAGGAVLLWSLMARQFRAAFRFFHPACLLAFAAAAVPWYALCTARNPDFFRIFFLEHNLQRYLTPVFQHPQPFWFFGPVLLAAVFPWTALVAPLILDASRALKKGEWRDSPSLFFGCWVIAPLLFFSFSESKLPGYILPAVPPLVLILAATLARRLSPPVSLVARVAGAGRLHSPAAFSACRHLAPAIARGLRPGLAGRVDTVVVAGRNRRGRLRGTGLDPARARRASGSGHPDGRAGGRNGDERPAAPRSISLGPRGGPHHDGASRANRLHLCSGSGSLARVRA